MAVRPSAFVLIEQDHLFDTFISTLQKSINCSYSFQIFGESDVVMCVSKCSGDINNTGKKYYDSAIIVPLFRLDSSIFQLSCPGANAVALENHASNLE